MTSTHTSLGIRFFLAATLGMATLLSAQQGSAADTRVFHADLVGSEEVPPNPSTAHGSFTGGLNDDNTFTYSVTSTGFATPFRAGHIHIAPRGVAGPIIIPFDCNTTGTICSGTSAPLGNVELDALSTGKTYANLHSEAFPSGEIRGQLASVAETPPPEVEVRKFIGSATRVGTTVAPGSNRGAEVTLSGRFTLDTPLDLRRSTATIADLVGEIGGAGELVRGPLGEDALPIPLVLIRVNRQGTDATYRATATRTDPSCRLKIKGRGRQAYDFTLDCKRGDGATIPFAPELCVGVSRPVTLLRTGFIINAGTTVRVQMTQPWRCMMAHGSVRELRTSGSDRSGTPGDGGGGGSNRAPRADFRMDTRSGPAPLTIAFSNRSYDPDGEPFTSLWDFGDGNQSTETDPTHTYDIPGEFRVSLIVTDPRGVASTPKMDIVNVQAPEEEPVEENEPPLADFRMSIKSGPAPLTVAFSNRSSDPDGDVLSSLWDFGDGSTSTETNPTHTYASPGQFRVSLVVTDARGAVSEPKTDIVNVRPPVEPPVAENDPPRADFRLSIRSGPAPLTVVFTNRSFDPDGDSFHSLWDFGDGSTSTETNPTHTYTSPGEFRVSLVVTDAHGAASVPKTDIVNVRAPVEPPVEENQPPRADFRLSVRSGPAPLTVVFSNRSYDPDGDAFHSLWDFGDGTQSTETNPTHTYTSPGEFRVSLLVTDAHGAVSAPKADFVNVRAPVEPPVEENQPPRADFRMDVRSGPAPLTVTFTNRSYDPDGDAFDSLWDFGDGTQSTEASPTHTYATPGDFRVTLVVTDARGLSSSPKRDNVGVR